MVATYLEGRFDTESVTCNVAADATTLVATCYETVGTRRPGTRASSG